VLATAQSLLAAMVALGSVLGMLAWGPLYAAKGGASVFTAAAMVAAVGCSFVIILVKISDRIESVEPTEPGQKAAPTPENS
jgi:Na+/melibiose symporter-like transporter